MIVTQKLCFQIGMFLEVCIVLFYTLYKASKNDL